MGATFGFGENWEAFSKAIGKDNFAEAERSLAELIPDIAGKSFLDIGCGSGLFSIAAARLGASPVLGIDRDPLCIKVSRENLKRFAGGHITSSPDTVTFKVGSILEWPGDQVRYDIVYSWGVLHHTGRMYDAFLKAAALVAQSGRLVIAVYNRHRTSGVWKTIKRWYAVSPGPVRGAMIGILYPVIAAAKIFVLHKNPFRVRRGMTFYRDVVDWIGGYPYEYASIDEVCSFFAGQGFRIERVIPTDTMIGCNEFIFRKK
ncbi:MAG: 50S ribosomal protein L11 methyltransferase [Candidatus Omnitrophica bacterium]|nr:50S ribosomal protein L11 methyltransferase [Candidatus Omnitrophota bacterium]